MKKTLKYFLPLIDLLSSPIVLVSLIILKFISRLGMRKMFFSRNLFYLTGIYPVKDHYYEPLINPKHLYKSLSEERIFSGINWNIESQLELLSSFNFENELKKIPENYISDTEFH